MPKPLPIELRQRAVDAYKAGEGNRDEIAERFKISEPSLRRWLKSDAQGASLEPKPPSGGKASQKLFDVHIQALLSWVEQEPDIYLHELAYKIKEEYGITIDPSQICRLLKAQNLTRKKKVVHDPNKTRPDVEGERVLLSVWRVR